MPKEKQPGRLFEIPSPEKQPEIKSPVDPEEPVIPEEEPDIIPDDDPNEKPPSEIPPPGEGY